MVTPEKWRLRADLSRKTYRTINGTGVLQTTKTFALYTRKDGIVRYCVPSTKIRKGTIARSIKMLHYSPLTSSTLGSTARSLRLRWGPAVCGSDRE